MPRVIFRREKAPVLSSALCQTYKAHKKGRVAVTATKWLRELCTLVGLLQIKEPLTATNHSSATQQLPPVIETFFISVPFFTCLALC